MSLPNYTNARFPAPMAYGGDWTMYERTHIEQAAPGYERRDPWWSGPRRQWASLAYGTSTADTKRIWDFFHQQRGRAVGFIGFDPEDYVSKYVRFATDRLTIRHSGWSLRCGQLESGTIAYDCDVAMIDIWPGALQASGADAPPPPAVAIPTNPGGYPDFPSQYVFNAEMWCEFTTTIVTTSRGEEWRVNECGPFPRYGASINLQVIEGADVVPAFNFFFDRQGRYKAFWFALPGIYAGPMRFAQDQIQMPRQDREVFSLRLDMISLPEQGEFVA